MSHSPRLTLSPSAYSVLLSLDLHCLSYPSYHPPGPTRDSGLDYYLPFHRSHRCSLCVLNTLQVELCNHTSLKKKLLLSNYFPPFFVYSITPLPSSNAISFEQLYLFGMCILYDKICIFLHHGSTDFLLFSTKPR